MTDKFYMLPEPELRFGGGQLSDDPHDGLALFGPAESRANLPDNVVIGTHEGLSLWRAWVRLMNSPVAHEDRTRHRLWPPFPGFDVAFSTEWPSPLKEYGLDRHALLAAASKSDRYERAFATTNLYLDPIRKQIPKLDAMPAVAVCVVPDEVYLNCRPKSLVADRSDTPKTHVQRRQLRDALSDRESGQLTFDFIEKPPDLEQYEMSPDFRRQLKARVMQHDIPVQVVRESTLSLTAKTKRVVTPLSDRLWNMGAALFYKCGRKPWTTPWARDGVCYIGLSYRKAERTNENACCAAQMFLDSGDGIVFVGEFGPWYSEEKGEFHLSPRAAENLLRGAVATYMEQDGRSLSEIFLHARSGMNPQEFEGFQRACPAGVKIVGIRVRKDRYGPRLFRHDNHPQPARRGRYPVLRGTFWQRTERHGLLFTTGFKPRIATYDGWEVPVPLSITVQHGDADLLQVAGDILGLTKLNYNACRLGESEPITVKYSDRIGAILLANREVPRSQWRHNSRYYI